MMIVNGRYNDTLTSIGDIWCVPKVVQSILKLVEDKNGEVQNLAVKWCVSVLCMAV